MENSHHWRRVSVTMYKVQVLPADSQALQSPAHINRTTHPTINI